MGKTTYLVILQNETETGSSGGLLTAETMKVSNGEIGAMTFHLLILGNYHDMWRITQCLNQIYMWTSSTYECWMWVNEARVQDVGLYPGLKYINGICSTMAHRARNFSCKIPCLRSGGD